MRFCHLSNHLREECPDGCGGCSCVHTWDEYHMPEMPVFATVPGGSKDTRDYRYRADFDKGLYAYEKAVGDGLEPESSTLEGVRKAKERAMSQERALKKLDKMGVDADSVRTMPGVGR